ncbi:L-rhamnose-1-dehydrogenase [Meyerozyma guilliermondii]|nr:L-rhamnose-1-dehydrogenase [Naganishia cerealis]
MSLLQGKTVAITGAATGIGRALAIGLHKHGANVAINFMHGQEDLVDELRTLVPGLLAVPGDISKPETAEDLIKQTVQTFGELNIFVSNAGVCKFEKFTDIDYELYRRTVSVNLDGAFFATQAAAKAMISQGKGGSIIGISSISALVGGGLQTHYTPTKAGILSLMQSTACALGEHGIRCNAVLPGTIRTQLNEQDLKNPDKKAYMESRIPLGRLGSPDDLVGPVVFLASELSSYVTGAQILVDGGLFVNLQ